MNKMKYQKVNNFQGFALIKVMLLCVIGSIILFLAIDSSSMLNDARIRAFLDEINGYKANLIDFQIKRGRWPGDLDNDTYFSWCGGFACPNVESSNSYTTKTQEYFRYNFTEPYNKLSPHPLVAPFIDIYLLKGGTSFKPDTELYDKFIVGKTIPHVESLNNLYWFFYTFAYFEEPLDTSYNFLNKVTPNTIWFGSDTINGFNVRRYLKTFKIIDEKIDDGDYLAGDVRSYCSPKGCSRIFVLLSNNN